MQDRIEKKIKRIKNYLRIIDQLKPDCISKIHTDPIYKGALLHYLYIVSDSCVSIAEMIIKYKNLEQPESYYEAIDILGEHKIIPPEFAYEFAKIASFRNFLSHDYEEINYKIICEEILGKLEDVEIYLNYIAKSL
ncbi:MAG: DUF86 domain-containing protein [Candidatus Acididesulfobacter diazotrophicus]|jgi:uncharacterized protein YutE (UPF0331/DUF86 family)|uniref:DUF86 domain-containing protein n=1 Tax=Candidatus Acididesulfobacter diazotrophicus TaxID=2597226 RepID=A0A519BN13_9DELT|nr:MAG: DUF86 domain-containing protein [Candidatus Acididesulfobacter diazotrophicus]